jgi:hypothetical protein
MQIFLSSVAKDLKNERQAVIQQISKLGDRPIGMEYFGAAPQPPLDECLAKVEEADLMILVLGPSYGSIHPETGVSYTENEFQHARKIGIDILVFVVPKLADKIAAANDGASAAKYQEFLKSVQAAYLYEEFTNPDHLAAAVSAAISNYKKNHGELGRRLNPFASWNQYFDRLLDPQKYFNHAWSLVGRETVIAQINAFVTSEKKVGILYGAGGLGKSKVLLEFCKSFNEKTSGWEIRFLRESTAWSDEIVRALPADPCIIVIDDVHRFADLDQALALLRSGQYAPRTKFLFTARPSGRRTVETVALRSVDTSELTEIANLSPLKSKEVMELALQALKSAVQQYADRLVRISSDCPLVTVIGGRLISEKRIQPELFATDEEFRKAVLDGFVEELTKILPAPDKIWAELLVLVSAIGPFRIANPQLRETSAKFLQVKPWELVERFGVLEQAGLLRRRGGLLEVAPDVLGDHLLHTRCVSASAQDTGYVAELFSTFAPQAAGNLFTNLSELQWRIDQTSKKPQILASIWSALKEEFATADYFGRVRILEVIESAALYQPAQALDLVRQAISLE